MRDSRWGEGNEMGFTELKTTATTVISAATEKKQCL